MFRGMIDGVRSKWIFANITSLWDAWWVARVEETELRSVGTFRACTTIYTTGKNQKFTSNDQLTFIGYDLMTAVLFQDNLQVDIAESVVSGPAVSDINPDSVAQE